jgi:hypothetical protein
MWDNLIFGASKAVFEINVSVTMSKAALITPNVIDF